MTICLIQGHPHGNSGHFCHALADAYEAGAREAGATVNRLAIAALDFPLLSDPDDFPTPPPASIREAQEAVSAADHLVIVYPLWLGTMPALLKAFFEQLCRNEFAIAQNEKGGWPRQMLKGKSARVIVTMGMPAPAYRLFFGAHGVKSMESGILGMAGIKPVHDTLIGGAGELTPDQARKHLDHVRNLGRHEK
ncbi:NAD(P)H-dependent oxidoreductase [Aquisalinus flavus]|uniref:Dehydrogenase n=1 Tax=Aquisalinus flavus TaxID=1526572 RepID=A0A8J2V355_9PROT|nr:NAD(P)H-dependent oxidoreductase [Aquisalinus flavus]MBD0426028.1 NAD(P)H-dependent oxidoreductase [Aquisalinus flavus]UNE48380.1 NAD(P)H-dependent oxidoreductase [Aquisalinus flavus]GGD11291.1 dehydrogenase [Aquisalinus flavus]